MHGMLDAAGEEDPAWRRPTASPSPVDARRLAANLVADVRSDGPELLFVDGVDIGPALEQQLFFALRDGTAGQPGVLRGVVEQATATVRRLATVAAALRPHRVPDSGDRPIVVLVRSPARAPILRLVGVELERLGGGPLAIVRVGAAARSGLPGFRSARLFDLLDARMATDLVRRHGGPSLTAATQPWEARLGVESAAAMRLVAARELSRIALGALGLRSVVRHWSPSLLVGFDEVGTWSRILPAVARRGAIPSLNLPHAEAADPVAIAGAAYHRMAVYGARAAAILRAAGIDAERIVETGAALFDPFIRTPGGGASSADPSGPRRVLFAAQYVQGAMTEAGLEACHVAALAVAAVSTPSELIVLPHPVEPPGLIAGIVARHPVPPGVTLRVARPGTLRELLDDAWLMMTCWSNSVFEAALRGVPTIMVDAFGVSPVTYAREGLGIGVADAEGAAAAARALLDPAVRAQTAARARAVLPEHLGPLDGRASERTARLILSLAGPA